MELTRGDIINEGLDRAGRPDLIVEARLWLNLFLDEIYQNQDFHWLKKTVNDLPTTQNQLLPLDYRAAVAASVGPQGNSQPISIIWDEQEYTEKRNLLDGQKTDIPVGIYINQETKTVQFLPELNNTQVWNLTYYFIPDIPDHKDSSADNEIPVWRAAYSILTDAIFQKALEYNDDARQTQADQRVMQKIVQNKMNNHDRRAGKSRIKLGKSFRKRFD